MAGKYRDMEELKIFPGWEFGRAKLGIMETLHINLAPCTIY